MVKVPGAVCKFCESRKDVYEVDFGGDLVCSECLKNSFLCSKCNHTHVDKEPVLHEGQAYCPDCAPKICGCCNRRFAEVETEDGLVCRHCFNNFYFTCDCGVRHKGRGIAYDLLRFRYPGAALQFGTCQKCIEAKTSTIEPTPVFQCEDCGNWAHHKRWCELCLPDHVCPGCGREGAENVMRTVHGAGCSDCRHKNGWGFIHEWNYTPQKFNTYGEGPLLYGIENEMTTGGEEPIQPVLDHIAREFHEDRVYAMWDGTIEPRGFGVEVVSHPMSLDELKRYKLERMFHKSLKRHRSCGMHIHMSRAAFNTTQLYLFMKFIGENPGFIKQIAERPPGPKKWMFSNKNTLLEKAEGAPVDPHKYMDINLKHPASIEIRIFAGVTAKEGLYKNIEFCDALYSLTKNAKNRHEQIEVDTFKKFVEVVGEYPHLDEYLKNLPEIPEEPRELQTGDRVIYNGGGGYTIGMNNPALGSRWACIGVITSRSNGWFQVQWDNHMTNSYGLGTLELYDPNTHGPLF